ncbi:glycosyltransferase family 4 protein [Luteitalea sp.]
MGFLVSPDAFLAEHKSGAPRVHAEIIENSVQTLTSHQIHLVADWSDRFAAERHQPELLRVVDCWRRQGRHVTVRPFEELANVLALPDTVFVTSGDQWLRLAFARAHVRGSTAALCGLMHSTLWADVLPKLMALRQLWRRRDRLIVPSDTGLSIVRHLLGATDAVVPSADNPVQLDRVPYGVPREAFDVPPRTTARERLRIPAATFAIAYVGRLTDVQKADLDVLLVVSRRLVARGIPIQLVVAGSEQRRGYVAELERKALALGVSQHTRLYTSVDERLKREVLAACDVCVYPSDNIQETFGVALVEAMAAGKPVVASSWSGHRDIVKPEETGILVDALYALSREMADVCLLSRPFPAAGTVLAAGTVVDVDALERALSRLAGDRALCERLGQQARDIAGKYYLWPGVVCAFEDVWKQQLGCADLTREPTSDTCKQPANSHILDTFGAQRLRTITLNSESRRMLASQHAPEWALVPPDLHGEASDLLMSLRRAKHYTVTVECPAPHAALLLAKKGLVSCGRITDRQDTEKGK